MGDVTQAVDAWRLWRVMRLFRARKPLTKHRLLVLRLSLYFRRHGLYLRVSFATARVHLVLFVDRGVHFVCGTWTSRLTLEFFRVSSRIQDFKHSPESSETVA